MERPAVQARESLYIGYGTPNLEAKKLLPADFVNDAAIFPPADLMPKLEGANPNAASNELRLEIYSAFKAAIGA